MRLFTWLPYLIFIFEMYSTMSKSTGLTSTSKENYLATPIGGRTAFPVPQPVPLRTPPAAHSGDGGASLAASLRSLLPVLATIAPAVSSLCALHAKTFETVRTDRQLLAEHETHLARLEQHMRTPREPQAPAGWNRLNKQQVELLCTVALKLLQLKPHAYKGVLGTVCTARAMPKVLLVPPLYPPNFTVSSLMPTHSCWCVLPFSAAVLPLPHCPMPSSLLLPSSTC